MYFTSSFTISSCRSQAVNNIRLYQINDTSFFLQLIKTHSRRHRAAGYGHDCRRILPLPFVGCSQLQTVCIAATHRAPSKGFLSSP
mmetsp:Transcript_8933/g.26835  ORF Transcript_8933/g.26835 Transcript_8933/m.26835 type:complete len:86 (+) Transcript_8933:530-787(+)